MSGGLQSVRITRSPEDILVRESPDADIYDVFGLSSGGFPVIDTTDAGDAVDDVTMETELMGQSAKKQRGKWAPHHGDCYAIVGPADSTSKKYTRNVCYNVDHQQMDTVKGTSYWQYESDASGSASGTADMERIWVHGRPYHHGSAVHHADGLAKPTQTVEHAERDCETKTDSIYVESGSPATVGISREWAKTTCKYEWIGPVLQGEEGNHAAEWETNDAIDAGQARAVALSIPVHAATKEGCPIWDVLHGQWVDV